MKYFVLLAGYGEMTGWDGLTAEQQEAEMAKHVAFDEACAARPGVEIVSAEALGDGSTATTLRTRGGEMAITDGPFAEAAEQIGGYYVFLVPNLMLNFYAWGLSVNVVRPLAPDRTKVSYLTYVADESRLDRGAGAALDRVEREDEAVVEAVQRGIGSRLYERGRYSPTREQGVHHFHRLLAAALDG